VPDPDLEILRPYQWGNEEIHVGELEVPQDWVGASMLLTITGEGTYQVELPDDTIATGTLRERLSLPETGFSLVLGRTGRTFWVESFLWPEAAACRD